MGLFRTHEEYMAIRRWEERMAAVLDSTSDRLTSEQSEWGRDFLAHAEYGLAVESVADWLSEDEHPISDAERAEILALAAEIASTTQARVANALVHCLPRDTTG